MQPFINVFDYPQDFFESVSDSDLPLRKDLSLIVRIESGSHISVSDTLYAKEIFDITMKLYELLMNRKYEIMPINQGMEVLFDDEHNVFTLEHFDEDIRLLSASQA